MEIYDLINDFHITDVRSSETKSIFYNDKEYMITYSINHINGHESYSICDDKGNDIPNDSMMGKAIIKAVTTDY